MFKIKHEWFLRIYVICSHFNLQITINFVQYVLVIRRKDHGLTDIESNEGRRPEFNTISVRP